MVTFIVNANGTLSINQQISGTNNRGGGLLAFSPNGQLLTVGDENGIAVYSKSGNTFSFLNAVESNGIWDIKFSPNGKIVTTSRLEDSAIDVYGVDPKQGLVLSQTFIMTKSLQGPRALSFSSDGKFLAIANPVFWYNLGFFVCHVTYPSSLPR